MSKKLVAYFSASGATAAVAKTLAEAAGADLYEIRPQVPYSPADLDWTNKKSRSSVEMNDKSFRPPLADRDAPVKDCDTIFLGFPIWWYTAPTIINTFLESYDFTGKTIILFTTSGGSGTGSSATNLHSLASAATWLDGQRFSGGASRSAVETENNPTRSGQASETWQSRQRHLISENPVTQREGQNLSDESGREGKRPLFRFTVQNISGPHGHFFAMSPRFVTSPGFTES